MITPELENYIKQSRAQGIADAQIRQNLTSGGGWSESDLNEAFGGFQAPAFVPTVGTSTTLAFAGGSAWIIGGIIGIILLAGGGFFGYKYFNNKNSQIDMVLDVLSQEESKMVVPDNTMPENSAPLNGTVSATEEISGKISSDTCLYESLREYPQAKKAEGSSTGAKLAGACGVVYYTTDSPAEVEKYYLIAPDGIKVGQFDEMLGMYKMMYMGYNNQSAAYPMHASDFYKPHSTLVAMRGDKMAFIAIGTTDIIKKIYQISGKEYLNNTHTEIFILEKKKEF